MASTVIKASIETGRQQRRDRHRFADHSVTAYRALCKPLGQSADEVPTVRRVVEVIKDIAASLGNPPAVCRKRYVHPAVLDADMEGRLGSVIRTQPKRGLKIDEAAFLQFISARSPRSKARTPAKK